MMNYLIFAATWLLAVSGHVFAQHQEISEKPKMWKGKDSTTSESLTLLNVFRTGHFEGHFRYFFMATDNQKGLTDYYANAAGGGIRFESNKLFGFQFAVSGFYIFNIGSSDLSKKDSVTNQSNRYEIALFDIDNPNNRKDLDRLEELFLKYSYKNTKIIFGRQLINTPFINLQDGRMRPTIVEGVWLETHAKDKLKLEAGWLYAISPRGTTKWYNVNKSVGIYPSGINTDGTKSDYAENIESAGVGLLGAELKVNSWLNVKLSDCYFENVQNSALLQTDMLFKVNEKSSVIAALQGIRQDAINDGGNNDPSKTYINKGAKAFAYGAKLGWRRNEFEVSANYTRITKDGRYLMPREWGRDPFFTFLPRERNDGAGDVHAVVTKVNYNFKKQRVKISLAAGYFSLPDVKNFELNKYGLPSYTQINADVRYSFNKFLKGLEMQFLLVAKVRNGETYNNKRFEFNKVNMLLSNFVLNYHF
jgi:hypothetical protein